MRVFAALLLVAAAAPGSPDPNPLLHEERSWKGVIEVTSISHEPPVGKGREEQHERIEFRLVSRPMRRTLGWPRLPMTMREAKGSWSIRVDTRSGEAEQAIVRKGRRSGRLHGRVMGYVEPTTGRYRLAARVSPNTLPVKVLMSGMYHGAFTTWRTTFARQSFLASFDVRGRANEDVTVLEGEKTFVDRKVWLARDVKITWRIERIDPLVSGRVVNQHGEPVAGMTVHARYRNGQGTLLREGKTDAAGRFALPAWGGFWNVTLTGMFQAGLVVAGKRLPNGVSLEPDSVPGLDVSVNVYHLLALPRRELLARHFQGDVDKYLAYLKERTPKERLQAALLLPPGER